jgi:hypothetical protein
MTPFEEQIWVAVFTHVFCVTQDAQNRLMSQCYQRGPLPGLEATHITAAQMADKAVAGLRDARKQGLLRIWQPVETSVK